MAREQRGGWGQRALLLAGAVLLCEGTSPATVSSLEEDLKVIQNIGYYMQVGQAFDMRTMQPVSALVSSPDAIDMHTVEMETPLTSLSYALDDSWESKKKLMRLDVDAELEIMGGTEINIAGGLEYLKDKKTTSKSISMALGCIVHTKSRGLDAFHPDVRSSLNRKLIDSKLATHVVTGITYGQRTVGTFKSTYKNEEQKEDLSGYLKIGIKAAAFSGDLVGNLTLVNNKHGTETTIDSTIYADSVPTERLPTEFNETLDFVATAYLRLDGEIGVPLTYTLTPLKKLDSDAAVLAAALKEGDVVRARDVYQGLTDTELEIAELLRLQARGNALWVEQAVQMNNEFSEFKLKLQSRLAAALVRMRRGDTDGESVGDVLDAYYASDFEKMKARLAIGALEDRLLSFTQIVAPGDSIGVTVAESRSDFMGPVLDMTHDNVYALLVVDAERGQGDLQASVAFYDYARSTHRAGRGNCVWTLPEADAEGSSEEREKAEVCEEELAFTAVHFDSLCDALCPSKYCFKFDPSPEKRHITRACNTVLDASGNAKLPGACMPSDDLARQWNCWQRPTPDVPAADVATPLPTNGTGGGGADDDDDDENAEAIAVALFKKHVRAFPEDWCACPKTQIVQFKRTGEDMKVDVNLIAVPRAAHVESAVPEPVDKLRPANQHVLLHVEHPEGQDPESMLRHKVVVLYNMMDEETGKWFEVSRTFETYTNALPIRVTGLQAGWLYRFKVAGVNEFGAGPMSVLSDVVKAGENVATPTAVHGARRVKGRLPGWAVGGSREMELDVALSAQHSEKLVSVLVTESDDAANPGRTAMCHVFESTLERVRCRVDLRETAAHVGKTLHVSVADETGLVAARGLVDVVAASEETCAGFEEDGRALLCEAELVHAETRVQMDPLNQMVVLTVATETEERGPEFAGWKLTAAVAGEDSGAVVAEAVVYGAATEVEMWGLTAGERYVFQLAALGEEDQTTRSFPEGGFRVGVRMPVLKARPGAGKVGSPRANVLPGWASYNEGKGFPVTVSLTVPAETKIQHVELKVSPEGEDIWVACRSLRPVAGSEEEKECVVPINLMLEMATNQEMKMPEWVPLRVLDVSRRLLGEGFAEWNDVSEEACAEFEMRASGADAWLLCEVNENGKQTLQCVEPSTGANAPCGGCAGGPNFIGRKCTNVLCSDADKAHCPVTGTCLQAGGTSEDELQDVCSRLCGSGSRYHAGVRLCAQACQVSGDAMSQQSIPAGTTKTVRFCEDTSLYAAQQDSSLFVLKCPATNLVPVHVEQATGAVAPWFKKAAPPTCVPCSRANQCSGGRSRSARVEGGRCVCTCRGWYDPNNGCATCAAPYVEEAGRCVECSSRAYCSGHGRAARVSPTQCRCSCQRKYYGEHCERRCDSERFYNGKCLMPYDVAWSDRRACAPGLKKQVYLPGRSQHLTECSGGWVDESRWTTKRCTLGQQNSPNCGIWKRYKNRTYLKFREFLFFKSESSCLAACCQRSWCTHASYYPFHILKLFKIKGWICGLTSESTKVGTTARSGATAYQVASLNQPHVCYHWPRRWWTTFCSNRRKRCALP